MSRNFFLLGSCLVLAVAAQPAVAGKPLAFHMSGDGVFNPPNIGTPHGGNAGLVLGDGSGLAPYTGDGNDFTLGGVQLGHNEHQGAVQTKTTGIMGNGVITWLGHTAVNPDAPEKGPKKVHITKTDHGDIYFTYPGRFVLDLTGGFSGTAGSITGLANFVVTGGTGMFEKASGRVNVVVVSTDADPSDGADFHYEFDGFVILKN